MTLDEAIQHSKEVSINKRRRFEDIYGQERLTAEERTEGIACLDCSEEHAQLAFWLEELKARREADKWISVKERTPDDLEPVNITWINHNPEPYYKEIKGKPFTATGVYFNGQWYWWSTLCTDILAEYSHNYDDIVDKAIEITHWRPLPKAPESEAENETDN